MSLFAYVNYNSPDGCIVVSCNSRLLLSLVALRAPLRPPAVFDAQGTLVREPTSDISKGYHLTQAIGHDAIALRFDTRHNYHLPRGVK